MKDKLIELSQRSRDTYAKIWTIQQEITQIIQTLQSPELIKKFSDLELQTDIFNFWVCGAIDRIINEIEHNAYLEAKARDEMNEALRLENAHAEELEDENI